MSVSGMLRGWCDWPPVAPWSSSGSRAEWVIRSIRMAMSGSTSCGHGPNCETDVMGHEAWRGGVAAGGTGAAEQAAGDRLSRPTQRG
jgi:hypothetical protein